MVASHSPSVRTTAPDQRTALTQREIEVLHLVVEGHATKSIAGQLGISPRTVEIHRRHLLHKFGARNAADLVREAITQRDPI